MRQSPAHARDLFVIAPTLQTRCGVQCSVLNALLRVQAFRESKSVFFSSLVDCLYKHLEIKRVQLLGTGQARVLFSISTNWSVVAFHHVW